MKFKFFGLLAVSAFLAGCGCDTPQQVTDVVHQDTAGSAIQPGSVQAFMHEIGNRVYFDTDRAELSPQAQDRLRRQIAFLNQYKDRYPHIRIQSHCDERGTVEHNDGLGNRRAAAVKKFLIANGLEASRIASVCTYGKTKVLKEGSTEESWRENRVGIVIVVTPTTTPAAAEAQVAPTAMMAAPTAEPQELPAAATGL